MPVVQTVIDSATKSANAPVCVCHAFLRTHQQLQCDPAITTQLCTPISRLVVVVFSVFCGVCVCVCVCFQQGVIQAVDAEEPTRSAFRCVDNAVNTAIARTRYKHFYDGECRYRLLSTPAPRLREKYTLGSNVSLRPIVAKFFC